MAVATLNNMMKKTPWYASNEFIVFLLGAVLALHCWEVTHITNLESHVAVLEAGQRMHITSK